MISFFIPIRKNSKRVKNKNIKKIRNYSSGLTEIKVKQLSRFRSLIRKDKILKKIKFEYVISSDDNRVLKFLVKFPWIKSLKRSPAISGDNSLDKLIKYVPNVCDGDLILWSHVTSPFFNEKSYIFFLKQFLLSKKKYSSAFSANTIKTFIYNYTKKNWISHNTTKRKWPRTQDLDKFYSVNSAAFIAKRSVYLYHNDRIDKKPLPINISEKEAFDIDDEDDFKKFSKIIMKKNEL